MKRIYAFVMLVILGLIGLGGTVTHAGQSDLPPPATIEATCATLSFSATGLSDNFQVIPSISAEPSIYQGHPVNGVYNFTITIDRVYSAGYHWAITYLEDLASRGTQWSGDVVCGDNSTVLSVPWIEGSEFRAGSTTDSVVVAVGTPPTLPPALNPILPNTGSAGIWTLFVAVALISVGVGLLNYRRRSRKYLLDTETKRIHDELEHSKYRSPEDQERIFRETYSGPAQA